MKRMIFPLVALWLAVLLPASADSVVWTWDSPQGTEWGSYDEQFRLFVQCHGTDAVKVPVGQPVKQHVGGCPPNGSAPPAPPGNLTSLAIKARNLVGPDIASNMSQTKLKAILSSSSGATFENAVNRGDKHVTSMLINTAWPEPTRI
jgi:hypothetical protein